MIKRKPEIMAPAGDWTSLRAAVKAGCDAVYFGVKEFNMRSAAKNFPASDLLKITKFCHKHKVKAYLTLNTIIYEKEIKRAASLLKRAKKAGIDAVICWDLAVCRETLRHGLVPFVSTQMSVANSESILFLYRTFGIKRFVLARECSLKDLKKINSRLKKELGKKFSEIEIEVFAHGAMCVSVSGRCFISQYQFGKSANRGECLQPCRREYLIKDKDEKHEYIIGSDYVLSPKDLCTLPFIEKLIEAGVASLKIEGRNRSPEYVSTVISVYRRAVDFYFENRKRKDFKNKFLQLKKDLTKELASVYNRGFSAGFFLGKPLNQWAGIYGSKATTRKVYIGLVKKFYSRPRVAEIDIKTVGFKRGDTVMIQGPTTGVVTVTANSIEINHQKINRAEKGMSIALKTDGTVRKNDKVYVIRKVNR